MASKSKGATIQIKTSKKSVKLRMKFDPDSHTIYDVKKAYCDQEAPSMRPEKMVLYKSKKELADDGKTLKYYSITRIAVLSMTTRLVGGASSRESSIAIRTSTKMLKLRMKFDPDSCTVYDVKRAYSDEEAPHLKPENMVLYKSGIKLADGKLLRHYNINGAAVLSLATKIQGGGAPSNESGPVRIAIRSSTRTVRLRRKFHPDSHTIYHVKKAYCDQEALSMRPEKLVLYKAKRELADEKSLRFYDVTRVAIFTLTTRIIGGAL